VSAADVELVAALTIGAALTSPVPLAVAVVCALLAALALRLAVKPAVRVARAVRRAYRRRRYVDIPVLVDARRGAGRPLR
jgi:hypothetical protein